MRIHFRAQGRVQGVGYRYFVLQSAESFKLSGWVRNLPNGDVEGEAEGNETAVKTFLGKIQTGHSWARVDALDVKPVPPQQETSFKIVS